MPDCKIIKVVLKNDIQKFSRFKSTTPFTVMVYIDTQVVDIMLIVLSLFFGIFYARHILKKQKTSVGKIPMCLIWAAGFWNLLNWIGHLLAVLYVNMQSMLSGSFTYTFHFYAVMFLGVVFMLLSLLQLNFLQRMSQLGTVPYKSLKQVSVVIILLSLPIIPLNPIGSLPVISSLLILFTVAVTRKSWKLKADKEPVVARDPQAA